VFQGFDINKAEWIETKEEIAYIDFPFTVTHHYVKPYQHAGDHPSTETQTGSKGGYLCCSQTQEKTVGHTKKWHKFLQVT